MTIKAVLFDFSGTLMRIESARSWVDAVCGGTAPAAELRRYAELLEEAGALPGGAPPLRVPPELTELWATRDESAELHRAAFNTACRSPTPGCSVRQSKRWVRTRAGC